MEENFEPVARTRANYYTPGSPVQFVCVELLKGEVSGEHAVCLTFKNISRVTLTALEIHFKCKGVDGVILCEDEFEYRDLTAKPGESFGMDDAVFVTQKAITSVDVTLRNVYSGRKVVHLESIKRVRLPAPRRLSVEMQKALEARMTPVPSAEKDFNGYWNHPAEVNARATGKAGVEQLLNDQQVLAQYDASHKATNQILQTYDTVDLSSVGAAQEKGPAPAETVGHGAEAAQGQDHSEEHMR